MSRDDPNSEPRNPARAPRQPAEDIQSFDPDLDKAIKDTWSAELERRRKLLDAGEVKLFTWEEVRAELLADIDE